MGTKKWLLLAILVTGCAPWAMSPSHSYEVYVDPSFSDHQTKQIVAAERAWTDALGGYITFSQAPNVASSNVRVWATTVTQLHQKRGSTCIGFTKWHGEQSDVELPVDASVDDDTFERIARHELGHVIGARHLSPGHSMAEYVMEDPRTITCEDVYEVCRHWGSTCVWRNMGPCVTQSLTIKL